MVERFLKQEIQKWHFDHIDAFNKAKGSSHNHQTWEGGYRDHLTHCLCLASSLYDLIKPLPFSLESAIKVLYFHDVEKLFKYTVGLEKNWDKINYLKNLKNSYDIEFTPEEWNAITYIHGEGNEYSGERRVMNELAGFCHAIDVISARVLHDKKGIASD